jgi:hypothetical protein
MLAQSAARLATMRRWVTAGHAARSTEIMHVLIAREAVDQHLAVTGDILDPQTALADKARTALGAGKFLRTLVTGRARTRAPTPSLAHWAATCALAERRSRKLARSNVGLIARHQASTERNGGVLRRVFDIGAELYAMPRRSCTLTGSPAAGCSWANRSPVCGDGAGQTHKWSLPLDVIERDDKYLLRADVRGFRPDEVKIEV